MMLSLTYYSGVGVKSLLNLVPVLSLCEYQMREVGGENGITPKSGEITVHSFR